MRSCPPGSTAATAQSLMKAIGAWPSARAFSSDISTTAAAPSVSGEEFPAVTVPYRRSKAGLQRRQRLEGGVLPQRGCPCVTGSRTAEGPHRAHLRGQTSVLGRRGNRCGARPGRSRPAPPRLIPFSFAIFSADWPIVSPVEGSAMAGVCGTKSRGRSFASAGQPGPEGSRLLRLAPGSGPCACCAGSGRRTGSPPRRPRPRRCGPSGSRTPRRRWPGWRRHRPGSRCGRARLRQPHPQAHLPGEVGGLDRGNHLPHHHRRRPARDPPRSAPGARARTPCRDLARWRRGTRFPRGRTVSGIRLRSRLCGCSLGAAPEPARSLARVGVRRADLRGAGGAPDSVGVDACHKCG